jgi:molybdenum cofactor cytidylyltransferase
MTVAAIILAAGASTRMGQSKQRLAWKTGTLLSNAIHTARQAGISSITVVLGADEKSNRDALASENVNIVSNPQWESGMGSSLKAGLKRVVTSNHEIDSILVMVCDQPFVTPVHLRSLAAGLNNGVKAVFSQYAGTAGVPATFSKDLFYQLQGLDDDEGAKKIIQQLNKEEYSVVELKDGEIDLDTFEQYLRYKNL